MANNLSWLLVAVLLALLASCASEVKDGAPSRDEVDYRNIPDAVPRWEPITKAGNKSPYVVLGKTYHVLPSFINYRETGVASWYGTKFHGHHTSNGEDYNMYSMTAAHKTLPIPCYVRVTNLENGRSAIVRVNDRGPFHDNRIIDLSYAAARKLGVYDSGTARVEVAAIDPSDYQHNTVETPSDDREITPPLLPGPEPFLQVGAFSSRNAAEDYRKHTAQVTDHRVEVRQGSSQGRTVFKVLVGPFADKHNLIAVQESLRLKANLSSFVVYY